MSAGRTFVVFFLMMGRPPGSTQSRSSAASDVYKRQVLHDPFQHARVGLEEVFIEIVAAAFARTKDEVLSLIHISEPTRPH